MYFSKQKETLPPLQGFRPVNLDSRESYIDLVDRSGQG